MKLAYVIHRYGDVGGGAEQACRMVAERIAARPGWEVEVFTTGARGLDWVDEIPSGTTETAGVTVHRFDSKSGRDATFHDYSTELFSRGTPPTRAEQDRWFDLQGPVAPDLLDAAAASDADVVVLTPYLYWPSIRGVPRLTDRAVLQPAAHDEVAIHLEPARDAFLAARGFLFYSDAERRLVEGLFPVAGRPQAVIGLGVEPVPGDEAAFRDFAGIDDAPYLLCGPHRIDPGKGTTALAAFFARYKERHPGPLKLVFAGAVVDAPDPHPDIVLTGPVSDAQKWGAFAGAEVFVLASAYESFSIVLLEAWTAGRPALVNGACAVTREHVARAGGGLWYEGYGSFEVALERLTTDRALAAALGGAGRDHADLLYRWDRLIDRYCNFLQSIPAQGSRWDGGSR